MERLKASGATWTLFIDTDEFLVVKDTDKTRAGGANSFQALLKSCPFSDQSCVYMPRIMYNNATDTPSDPYQTRKYRQHLTFAKSNALPGKSIVDVSKLGVGEMVTIDPHIGISPVCFKLYGYRPFERPVGTPPPYTHTHRESARGRVRMDGLLC